jgi:two-component system, chemotaxis family, chemotaxis protein CheY
VEIKRLQSLVKWMLVTALAVVLAVAIPPLWVELSVGKAPLKTFRQHDQLRLGAEQLRLEVNHLAVIASSEEDPSTPAVQRRLDGVEASITRAMRQIEIATRGGGASPAWRQLADGYESRLRPALLAYRKPGEADLGVVRGQLRSSRDEFESLLGRLDRSAVEVAERGLSETAGIKMTTAAVAFFLAVIALPILVVQRANVTRTLGALASAAASAAATPKIVVADPRMSEDLIKVAGRVRELESANEGLQAEVSSLRERAGRAEDFEQRPLEIGLEAALKYLRGRSRATLGKEGQLGIVLNLKPEEVEKVQPLLQTETEFVKLEPPVPSPIAPAEPSKPTLLIVDDDRLNRTILRSCVSELDLNVLEAEDGEKAWQVLDQGTYVDLCLCDLMMPELDGFGFAKRVHGDRRFESLEIIFCTASAEKEHIAQAAEMGVRKYVVKPFNKEDVLKNVRLALEKALSRKDPMAAAQERLGIDAESYAQLMSMLNREVTETITFVRTALTRGQRRAAWTRINSLRGSSQMVGDHALAQTIIAVERELERGDVFFIITELEKLEEANRRMGQLANHLGKPPRGDKPADTAPHQEPVLAEAA